MKTVTASTNLDPAFLTRTLTEGYGPGAWHGPDLAAALSDVTEQNAFTRPASGRHNIAEIAVHHAWCARSVVSQLTGRPPAAFPLAGEDWFPLEKGSKFAWSEVVNLVADQQAKLVEAIADRTATAMSDEERFALVLGVTCHAVYHAGQIQLIKKLIPA